MNPATCFSSSTTNARIALHESYAYRRGVSMTYIIKSAYQNAALVAKWQGGKVTTRVEDRATLPLSHFATSVIVIGAIRKLRLGFGAERFLEVPEGGGFGGG